MSAPSLAEIQRRLWRLIAWPEGVRAALETEPGGAPPLAAWVRSDERLCAEDRLDVYANAYFYRIHDVLAEDFPTLAHALGEDAFHDLATSYLAVHPSRHPSLRHVGARLADFLAGHPAAASFRERLPCAADLARFEAASEDVFDAADLPAATREDLARVPPERWDGLPVVLRPSVRLLALGWPVHEARRALRDEQPLPALQPASLRLCVWRREEQVCTRELLPDEAEALAGAAAGIDFGSLCERIAAVHGDEEAPGRAAAWLGAWVDDGLLRRPDDRR